MAFGYAAMMFLEKEKIKMRRMLWRAHNINFAYLKGIENNPIGLDGEEDEEGEKVEQEI